MDSFADQKDEVRDFWNAEPCGSRYVDGQDSFAVHTQARYSLEPYIWNFAGFLEARGLRVLEVGVGIGADYLEWLKAGANATGIDLSEPSIENARKRCVESGYGPDLRVADAETLPFPDSTFDVVYSYGVMHHSPNTAQCVREAYRVLKPSGRARIMIYRHPSVTGALLWLRYGWFRGQSLRETVARHLESPGTKTYTQDEAHALFADFADIKVETVFSPGDLLLHQPSSRYQSRFYRLVWTLFPRWFVRRFCKNWGLFLLISATKRA
jgi:ubiquinone/menaquinone biosynthesis C-methylase UbiE